MSLCTRCRDQTVTQLGRVTVQQPERAESWVSVDLRCRLSWCGSRLTLACVIFSPVIFLFADEDRTHVLKCKKLYKVGIMANSLAGKGRFLKRYWWDCTVDSNWQGSPWRMWKETNPKWTSTGWRNHWKQPKTASPKEHYYCVHRPYKLKKKGKKKVRVLASLNNKCGKIWGQMKFNVFLYLRTS